MCFGQCVLFIALKAFHQLAEVKLTVPQQLCVMTNGFLRQVEFDWRGRRTHDALVGLVSEAAAISKSNALLVSAALSFGSAIVDPFTSYNY